MQPSDRERSQLAETLKVARRAMARDLLTEEIAALGESDLTIAQLACLLLLDDGEARGVKQLAGHLGRSLSATSRLLDQLVRRRLINRRQDPEDRRGRLVALGEGGRRLIEALAERRAAAQLRLMETLSSEEREQVARGMALLAEAARRRSSHER